VLEYYKSCDSYQQASSLKTINLVKLIVSLLEEPFMKWGLNFIGLLKLVGKHTWNKYILVAMNYVTKWVEVRTLQTNITIMIAKFNYKCTSPDLVVHYHWSQTTEFISLMMISRI
jgi:hypothetical protein